MARQTVPVDGNAIRVGLVGRGIGASLTPIMHQREGARLGLEYDYMLLDFDTLGLENADLALVLDHARKAGFAGLNVTYPFKQQALALLDEISPDAAGIGAVNTIVFENGHTVGHNTDCWGFAESFRRNMGSAPRDRVLQLGAGGAGAAVAQALLGLGVDRLAIFDIDEGRAVALRDKFDGQFPGRVFVATDLQSAIRAAQGIVNTTPVGMAKLPGTPLDPRTLDPGQWIADIIYFPRETQLLAAARERGCRVLSGGGMAIFQAVRAFELFSGRTPDPMEMARTFQAEA
ncbi:shikimate dehydrogenase [Pelagibacterium sediminicola]|uniref:shikimate dehydrogenase n=1 Tax=Pelagibacterium sediminicola TaxID=2248761 RepID=UPI0018E4E29C|nr:shikimate dehydrogenase [Pelagibacterium sediminicola]